jgi:hypothetical protein
MARNVTRAGEGERTQRGPVLGVIDGLGILQKERLDLGFLGSLKEARRTTERKQSTRAMIAGSIKSRYWISLGTKIGFQTDPAPVFGVN